MDASALGQANLLRLNRRAGDGFDFLLQYLRVYKQAGIES
jgi:hypothetical protein